MINTASSGGKAADIGRGKKKSKPKTKRKPVKGKLPKLYGVPVGGR